MGKVSEETVSVNGEFFRRVVSFDSRGGKVFRCKLPHATELTIGESEVSGASFDECILAFDAANARAKAAASVTSKVICYTLKARLYRQEPFREIRTLDDGFRGTGGLGLLLQVAVFEETTTTLDGQSRHKYKHVDSSLPYANRPDIYRDHKHPHVIPWTEDHEAWFLALVTSFEDLIVRLHDAFDEPEVITRAIDSGGNLLLTTEVSR